MHVDVRHTRILVVEDDPVFRIPLCAVLAAAGFDVRSAESAEAAEDLLAQGPVDVVLSDIGLPRMDGATLASRHPDTPFVLMTGSPPAESSASEALPPTVRARLVKPLDVAHLLALLHEARMSTAARGEAAGLRAAPRQ
ncbi:MAG TPA: response regulator [Candidatus Acidoferrum sp.]|jgi:two-component system CheB/CheR fusion protein|nr:response regulator [Candidatus Acidoferrum sp.]